MDTAEAIASLNFDQLTLLEFEDDAGATQFASRQNLKVRSMVKMQPGHRNVKKKLIKVTFRNEMSFGWGCTSFVHKRTTMGGSFEARCPRRSHCTTNPKGKRVNCRCTISYVSDVEKEHVIHALEGD